jgi:hypothetical protein
MEWSGNQRLRLVRQLPTGAMSVSGWVSGTGIVIAFRTGRTITAKPTAAIPLAVCLVEAAVLEAERTGGGKIAVSAVIAVDALHQLLEWREIPLGNRDVRGCCLQLGRT